MPRRLPERRVRVHTDPAVAQDPVRVRADLRLVAVHPVGHVAEAHEPQQRRSRRDDEQSGPHPVSSHASHVGHRPLAQRCVARSRIVRGGGGVGGDLFAHRRGIRDTVAIPQSQFDTASEELQLEAEPYPRLT